MFVLTLISNIILQCSTIVLYKQFGVMIYLIASFRDLTYVDSRMGISVRLSIVPSALQGELLYKYPAASLHFNLFDNLKLSSSLKQRSKVQCKITLKDKIVLVGYYSVVMSLDSWEPISHKHPMTILSAERCGFTPL